MAKSSGMKNAPSKTGNKSGGGRSNATPSKSSGSPKNSSSGSKGGSKK